MTRMTMMFATACVYATTLAQAGDDAAATRPYFSNAAAHVAVDRVKAEKAYVADLRTGNQGVIESALAHAAWMSLMLPDEPFQDLRAEVNMLVVSAPSPEVRTRAYLAALVFDHPEIFQKTAGVMPGSAEELFVSLNAQLQEALSYGGRKYVR